MDVKKLILQLNQHTQRGNIMTLRKEIKIILTFDDGPAIGDNIFTDKILKTLCHNSVQNNISSIFFVQTHVPYRGGCPEGVYLLERALREGHKIGIHTGSLEDHEDHITRFNKKIARNSLDIQNELEEDIIRAKKFIQNLKNGYIPNFLRPPKNRYNDLVLEIYRKHGLKVLGWDIDSGDTFLNRMNKEQFITHLNSEIDTQLILGNDEIVILFHDIKEDTADYLHDLLAAIKNNVESNGIFKVIFTSDVSPVKFIA